MVKFTKVDSDEDYRYGDVFSLESGEGWSRLIIGPNGDHVRLLDRLSETWSSPDFYVLYVSLVSHTSNKPGRYQSPPMAKVDLDVFLYTHQRLLEGYGGQQTWVGNPKNGDLLIYDQHNIIYAYGDIAGYRGLLEEEAFTEGQVSIPFPHVHRYDGGHIQDEEALFNQFDWVYSELQEGDDY